MSIRSPQAVLEAICESGCRRARLPVARQLALGLLGGAYVALGGALALVGAGVGAVLSGTDPGLAKLLFGAVFSLGFVLCAIAGAELFTESCATVTCAVLVGATKWQKLLRSWGLVYVGNLLGALLVAFLIVWLPGLIYGGDLRRATVEIAQNKAGMSWLGLLLRGIGGNWLACLALWLATASDSTVGKILGYAFPIMAFAALGLEHSIANMLFIPLGMLYGAQVGLVDLLWRNLLPVTIGNIIGGAGLVGALYWWLYGRD